MTSLSARCFVRRTLGASLGMLALVAALVFAVDPFAHYRAPRFFKPQFAAKYALQMIPGVIRHMPHDTLVVGDSMMLNTDLADVRALLGWNAVKATAGGSWPSAMSRFLDIAFEPGARHAPPRNVIIGLGLTNFVYPHDVVQFDLPPSLYEPRPCREFQYLLNCDVITGPLPRAIQVTCGGGSKKYRKRADPDTMFASDLVEDENRPGKFGAGVVQAWLRSQRPSPPADSVTTVDGMCAGLDATILRHIRANPGTRFEIVLPPYSKIQWYFSTRKTNWPVMREFLAVALARLIAEPNVRVHGLQTRCDIVCNLDNYKDSVHHKPSINKWIIERIATGDAVLSIGGIPAYIDRLDAIGDPANQPGWVLELRP